MRVSGNAATLPKVATEQLAEPSAVHEKENTADELDDAGDRPAPRVICSAGPEPEVVHLVPNECVEADDHAPCSKKAKQERGDLFILVHARPQLSALPNG